MSHRLQGDLFEVEDVSSPGGTSSLSCARMLVVGGGQFFTRASVFVTKNLLRELAISLGLVSNVPFTLRVFNGGVLLEPIMAPTVL